MEVIRVEKKMCTSCMEEHEVKVVRVMEQTIFKNVQVEYPAVYYYCDFTDELYMDEKMMGNNDICMKNEYRKRLGLLTSGEIHDIRSKYDISQSDLCTLLGWGGKTITRYESHQVQDKAHDFILKKLNDDPEWFIDLLIESKQEIAEKAFHRCMKMATLLYERKQDKYLQKAIEAKYAGYFDKPLYNGNARLSLEKVVDVIRYFANSPNMENLFKVKLMKLLWYTDALSYKQRGHAMTGLVYQSMQMGALPIAHDSIIKLHGIVYEETEVGEGTAYHFEPTPNREYTSLLEEDIEILDIVIQKFGKMTKNEIVGFMHQELAFINTKQKEIISFKYAAKLLI